jgi:hypothetical protein
MRLCDDSSLTPEQRFSEVATILAAGVLRLAARRTLADEPASHPPAENPAESSFPGLEVPGESVLSVHNG